LDYVIAAVEGLIFSVIAGPLITRLGWFFALFLGPLAGGVIAEAVRWSIGHRRGRYIWLVVSGCVVIGELMGLAVFLPWLFYPGMDVSMLFSAVFGWLLPAGLYVVLAVGTVYARLR